MYMETNKKTRIRGLRGSYFRWVVPDLPDEVWDRKEKYKFQAYQKLINSKTAKKEIQYYSLAIEPHISGRPHLDMFLAFKKSVEIFPTELDFLCDRHGNLTKYRTLNQAILVYNRKSDRKALHNMTNLDYILNEAEIKKDPYAYLQKKVNQNPVFFDFLQYCHENDLFVQIKAWSYIKNKIKDYQIARAKTYLQTRPNIALITDETIKEHLSQDEQDEYHSWSFYKTIVNYLNDMSQYSWNRKTHTKQLYIRGKSRIGKTSLMEIVMKYCSVYPVGTENWFPKFENHCYQLMFWDEPRLNMMHMSQLLMLTDGQPFDLPFKGGSILKRDNQLWIMTSNESVEEQVLKMKKSIMKKSNNEYEDEQINALFNRIEEVVVPEGKNLFLLQKLIHPKRSY